MTDFIELNTTHAPTIVPAQPGYRLGWVYFEDVQNGRSEQATAADALEATTPIIAWQIVQEWCTDEWLATTRAVTMSGTYCDIDGHIVHIAPDGRVERSTDVDSWGSMSQFVAWVKAACPRYKQWKEAQQSCVS